MTTPGSVAVIGGGLIGSAAALALDRAGHHVVVVTRAPPPIIALDVDWRYGDARSDTAFAAVREADTLVLAGGSIGPATIVSSMSTAIENEVLPVLDLAEAAASNAAKSIVFISSGGTVYGPDAMLPTKEVNATAPINAYGIIKIMTEQALLEVGRRHGTHVISLRVSNPYGPGQIGTRRLGFVAAAIQSAVAGQPLTLWGDGRTTRDFVFIDDVGQAVVAAVGNRSFSGPVNIGSGSEQSLLAVCAIVGDCHGKPIELRFEAPRDCDVPRSVLDIDRARQVLGWSPMTMLREGIATTLRHAI